MASQVLRTIAGFFTLCILVVNRGRLIEVMAGQEIWLTAIPLRIGAHNMIRKISWF